MLSIKLRPVGKKKQISFRIIVAEKRSKLKGKFVEDIGWYNPHTDKFLVKKDRAKYWIDNGAKPTDSVHNILINSGVINGKKIPVHSKSKKKASEAEENKIEQNNVSNINVQNAQNIGDNKNDKEENVESSIGKEDDNISNDNMVENNNFEDSRINPNKNENKIKNNSKNEEKDVEDNNKNKQDLNKKDDNKNDKNKENLNSENKNGNNAKETKESNIKSIDNGIKQNDEN